MKVFFILVLLFCLPDAAGLHCSESQSDSIIHIGVSSQSFDKINRNDAVASLKAWVKAVMKEQNLQEQVDVKLYDSSEAIREAFQQNRLDAVSVTAEESLLLNVQPEYIFLPATDKGFHVRYVVIVHRDSGITNPKGLMGLNLTTYGGNQMLMAKTWLKTVLAGYPEKELSLTIAEMNTMENPSKAILQVFFRQAHAALVTEEAFELACELNPQLSKNLTVLSMSQPLIISFFIFRPTWQSISKTKLESAIIALHTTPGGRQVLTVFQKSRMEKQPGSVLKDTLQFLEDYRRLVRKGIQP